jgi:hypothetical protein
MHLPMRLPTPACMLTQLNGDAPCVCCCSQDRYRQAFSVCCIVSTNSTHLSPRCLLFLCPQVQATPRCQQMPSTSYFCMLQSHPYKHVTPFASTKVTHPPPPCMWLLAPAGTGQTTLSICAIAASPDLGFVCRFCLHPQAQARPRCPLMPSAP